MPDKSWLHCWLRPGCRCREYCIAATPRPADIACQPLSCDIADTIRHASLAIAASAEAEADDGLLMLADAELSDS